MQVLFRVAVFTVGLRLREYSFIFFHELLNTCPFDFPSDFLLESAT